MFLEVGEGLRVRLSSAVPIAEEPELLLGNQHTQL